jgi:hypothetical protein
VTRLGAGAAWLTGVGDDATGGAVTGAGGSCVGCGVTAFGAGLATVTGGAGFAVAAGAGARDFVESGTRGFGGVTAAGGAAGAGTVGAVASDCAPGCRTGMKRTESPTAIPAAPVPRDTSVQRAW